MTHHLHIVVVHRYYEWAREEMNDYEHTTANTENTNKNNRDSLF